MKPTKRSEPGAATRAVHGGTRQPSPRRAVASSVYHTTPLAFDDTEELVEAFEDPRRAGIYSRLANPTCRALEEKVAALGAVLDGAQR